MGMQSKTTQLCSKLLVFFACMYELVVTSDSHMNAFKHKYIFYFKCPYYSPFHCAVIIFAFLVLWRCKVYSQSTFMTYGARFKVQSPQKVHSTEKERYNTKATRLWRLLNSQLSILLRQKHLLLSQSKFLASLIYEKCLLKKGNTIIPTDCYWIIFN